MHQLPVPRSTVYVLSSDLFTLLLCYMTNCILDIDILPQFFMTVFVITF